MGGPIQSMKSSGDLQKHRWMLLGAALLIVGSYLLARELGPSLQAMCVDSPSREQVETALGLPLENLELRGGSICYKSFPRRLQHSRVDIEFLADDSLLVQIVSALEMDPEESATTSWANRSELHRSSLSCDPSGLCSLLVD